MPNAEPPSPSETRPTTAPARARPAVFLEREIYRRRRIVDAARWLPLVGLVLFVGPALLLGTPNPLAEGASTALRLVYFFFVWACLIGVCAVISRRLVAEDATGRDALPGDSDRAP